MNSKWFSFTKECQDSDIRVILFPHSGAGASFFASWGKTFAAANMDLYPVQYPMRESRMKDKAFTDLRAMLRAFADDSLQQLLGKKIVLYGKCFGSTAAFEMAQLLDREYGIRPELLVVSGGVVPSEMKVEKVSEGSGEEEFDRLLLKYDFVTEAQLNNSDFRKYYLPVLRADYIMQAEYECGSPICLPYRVLALCGSEDKKAGCESMKKWSAYTDSFTLRTFEGSHFFENKNTLPEICGLIKEQCRQNMNK